jgi:hypothetical protein
MAAASAGTSSTAILAAALASSATQVRINIADSALVRAPGGTNSAATAISSAIQAIAALIP